MEREEDKRDGITRLGGSERELKKGLESGGRRRGRAQQEGEKERD
jgi:hypothetical protein